jgi:predicted nucleotide-binding protein (sugar kinase/HSP70/actin superfamily)
MEDGSDVLAECFSVFGYKAKKLERSPDITCMDGRKALGGEDICLPGIMTLEDMIHRLKSRAFDRHREAFFQGSSEGPCRYGMYSFTMRRVLDEMGYEDVPVVTVGSKDDNAGLGIRFGIFTWAALVTHDLLLRMLHRTRPYEVNKGESDKVFAEAIKRLLQEIPIAEAKMPKWWVASLINASHLRRFESVLRWARKKFQNVSKKKIDLPLIGLIGEFYVRGSEDANQKVIRKLEEQGAEVWAAPMTEFFAYANYIRKKLL